MNIQSLQVKFNGVIGAFVILITIAVGATLLVAGNQEGDAQVIDLAARQRLLLVEMKETAVRLITALESESDSQALIQSLQGHLNTFDDSLKVLQAGGIVEVDRVQRAIPAPSLPVATSLEQVQGQWGPFKTALLVLLKPQVDVASDAFYDASLLIADAYGALADTTSASIPLLKAESEAKLARLKNILVMTIAATLILSVLAWFFVRSSIIRPITTLILGIYRMETDSDLTQRVPVSSNDEIGQLSSHFNAMAEKFQTIISELTKAATHIDQEADKLAVIATQTRDGVESQHGQLESVATSMNQMAASAHSIGNDTETAADTTSATVSEALRGQQAVQDSSAVFQNMVAATHRTAEQMAKLEEQADGIGAIVDVIGGVAEQTNLLALNAAIEAARAGEQGRGFAVVAEEVRSLANRTQQSTVEIQKMISQLQENASLAATYMGDGKSQAENSTSHTQQIGASLDHMIDSMEAVKGINTGIASAAQQQSSVTQAMTRSVTEISDAVGNTARRAEQTASSVTNLTDLSTQLRQMVERFKV